MWKMDLTMDLTMGLTLDLTTDLTMDLTMDLTLDLTMDLTMYLTMDLTIARMFLLTMKWGAHHGLSTFNSETMDIWPEVRSKQAN